MPTNFDLAPPGKTVDGLAAVPIDIQHITATLTFDGATSSGTGDATIDFIVGPDGGCPIFDLRQTITSVWLDGTPLTPADVALHDFGGGVGAELRVVDSVLAAASSHTLRFVYTLGTPQASTAGSYQPAMTWSAGPRLAFNFGFTDLGPGRYLESWVPANLIFDQFDLTLDLRILNTTVAHTPITNGTITVLGTNHWSLAFPARFTALSPLVELRASDAVTSQSGTVVLPGSGATITIEAWKLTGSAVDLTARIADISSFLIANEASTGIYLHGTRFVAFLNIGGMEYEGGTTTAVGSLRHETFHSWWGRGVKPAGQADGWLDEAWTVYNDAGATGSLPFDFTGAPVELSSRNPWVRLTPSASYTNGKRFFEGTASLMGVSNLTSHMATFYNGHTPRPVTTVQLEEFLVARSAEASVVDGFHRFVYGFPDPSPVPDLWIKDDPADSGNDLWAGTFWNSPDLWIRNADDGGTSHQPPEYGQDNWFHARVRNRSTSGTARHFVVTFNVKPWAGIEFVFPGDFLPCVAAVADFELGPGETRIVKARWPRAQVPPAGTHACWLAAALSRSDRPGSSLHVWEHNNLAQKNMIVVDVVPGRWIILPFVIDRLRLWRPRRVTLKLRRPPRWEKLEAAVLHGTDVFERKARPAVDLLKLDASSLHPPKDERLECGGSSMPPVSAEHLLEQGVGVAFAAGRLPRALLMLPGRGQLTMGLALRAPETAKSGETISMDLVQWDERRKRVTGGLAVMLRIRAPRLPAALAGRTVTSKGST
ncbi:MAG: hypothetical protein ABJB49_02325 [Nitrospirota bacterium]